MQRFCRSHFLCIWCCAVFVISSYVLFDLLDIDGSNFDHSPGSGLAAEERIAHEGGRHVSLGLSATALSPRVDQWAMMSSVSAPQATPSRPIRLLSRPRSAPSPPGTSTSHPDDDPVGPVAEL